MKKRDPDLDEPKGRWVEVPDFLPPPDELVFPKKSVKITISLSKDSVDFFKREAREHGVKYQQMIRTVVSKYAARFMDKAKK